VAKAISGRSVHTNATVMATVAIWKLRCRYRTEVVTFATAGRGEVMFDPRLSVCLILTRITKKTYGRIFTKFGEQIVGGPGKSWLNLESDLFAGNDIVPISTWRGGGVRCAECRPV